MRVKINKPRRSANNLQILQAKIRKELPQQLLNILNIALQMATEHTPKWSGLATEGWRVSLNGKTAVFTSKSTFEAPKYEGGIYDAQAPALNRKVVNKELNRIRLGVYAQCRAGKDVQITLYNSQPYAQKWLEEGSTLGVLLRSVNQDYYTFNDIARELRLAIRMDRAGGW